jgi:hypothetical protein
MREHPSKRQIRPDKRLVLALTAFFAFALLVSVQTLLTASTVAASGNVKLVEYPATTIPLAVSGIASTNGGTASGTAERGDTFSVTFNQALDPADIPATGTISMSGSGSTATITITSLTAPAGFTVTKYEANKNTSTATVAFALSNGNRSVTATITSDFTNPSGIQTGRAGTFTFAPSSTITNGYGTAANGSYTTPTTLLLF